MATHADLVQFVRVVGRGDGAAASRMLAADAALTSARIDRTEEFFVEECRGQVYAGDTALHAAAFAYDTALARRLVDAGADVRARNRRGGEPLHAAAMGSPDTYHWDPPRQRAVILYLAEVGGDPNAPAAGGATPLHRAVRNRCTAAVEALLRVGADPHLANDSGSTAFDLARWTTGRGGTGSAEARAEQQAIIDLLATFAATNR